ncbi:MAG: asparagine synthase-related protein, partial [Woeseiaceae bacterium]
MNIFLVATHQRSLQQTRIRAELRRMKAVYPALDVETIWDHRTPDNSILAASISADATLLNPRKVVSRSTNGVAFYSGLPIDPENRYSAHNADDIALHWDELKDRLEGTYSVVQISDRGNRLEIQTDLLGGEAVYYLRHKGGWLFSNSVLLLERLVGWRSLDDLGVSMYLHIGHTVGDRTLRRDIRMIGAAQRWTLTGTSNVPNKCCYYPLSNLANLSRKNLDDDVVRDLAGKLQGPLLSLAENFDSVVCPLTGGKDSRVIAALLMNANIDAKYFTFGDPTGGDARIASEVARKFGLNHEFKTVDEQGVFESWDKMCLQTVRSTDGMRSLHHLGGMAKSEPISGAGKDIYLWGACGEVARSFFGDLPFLKRNLTVQDIKNTLDRTGPDDSTGLVRESAKARARAWKDQCVDNCADQGLALLDIPDVFGNHYFDARRLSNNGRGLAQIRDTFTPYASRAFLEATFSLPVLSRFTEPLHFRLLETLSPGLHSFPFEKHPWRSQNPMINLARIRARKKARFVKLKMQRIRHRLSPPKANYSSVDSMFSRLDWFEDKRSYLRQFALDSTSSSVWDFVDRQ